MVRYERRLAMGNENDQMGCGCKPAEAAAKRSHLVTNHRGKYCGHHEKVGVVWSFKKVTRLLFYFVPRVRFRHRIN